MRFQPGSATFKRPLGIANGSFQNDREPVNEPGGQSLEASCIQGSVEQAAFLCVCVCAEGRGGRGSVGRQSWEGHRCLITAMLVTSS